MRTQNIHFVTGKGGVGKSSFALALAMHLADQGQNVLLAELGSRSFFADYLNRYFTYQPTTYKKNLSICLWSGKECLKEYAIHLLKIEAIYKLFFENKLSSRLIDIAPSLPEISILGKITSGIRKVGPPLEYDSIVVDAYATGHMMALLKAPRGMMEAIPLGPMGEQTRSILQIIKNKEICKYWVVCLPEELPVTETIELQNDLYNETHILPKLVLNKMLPYQEINSMQANTPEEVRFLNTLQHKIKKEQRLKDNLLQFNKDLYLEIPFFFESKPMQLTHLIQSTIAANWKEV